MRRGQIRHEPRGGEIAAADVNGSGCGLTMGFWRGHLVSCAAGRLEAMVVIVVEDFNLVRVYEIPHLQTMRQALSLRYSDTFHALCLVKHAYVGATRGSETRHDMVY